MANVVVVGAQWGDEGKGKIVDWLGERADIVARFQGGHNAGHTLVIDGVVYKLSLLPSGILRNGKRCVIGNGVVLDPWALTAEIDRLGGQGVAIGPAQLEIAENTVLILPLHVELDLMREIKSGSNKIGTTGRGIGPAYEDKVGRRAIRLSDLADPATLETRLDRLLEHHNALRRGHGEVVINRDELAQKLTEIAPKVLPYAAPVWKTLRNAQSKGENILFEGAQGALLDVDFGTYPFVTSSNTLAGAVATGTGVGPTSVNYVLGIVKAYTTRVGEGPFPTEQKNDIGNYLAQFGHEKGTVTGRDRRCGWFDAALVRQTATLSGMSGIALTKLDVLDGLEILKICTGYRLDGQALDCLPSTERELARIEPVYEEMPGWKGSTVGAKSWDALPSEAVAYIRRIEELIECPAAIISTSPERTDTICINDPFNV